MPRTSTPPLHHRGPWKMCIYQCWRLAVPRNAAWQLVVRRNEVPGVKGGITQSINTAENSAFGAGDNLFCNRASLPQQVNVPTIYASFLDTASVPPCGPPQARKEPGPRHTCSALPEQSPYRVNYHAHPSRSIAASAPTTAAPGASTGRKSSTTPSGKWSDGHVPLGKPLPAAFTAFTGLSACSTPAGGSASDTHRKSMVAQPPGRPYVNGMLNLARVP